MEYRLRPVDYDPFDEDPTSPAEIPGFKLKPVDYDPFEEEEPEGPAFAGVAPAISAAMQAPGSTSREILTSGMRLIRGGDIKTQEQEGILDKMIRSAETQTKREVERAPKAKIIPGIPITARDIAELPSNLAYSMIAAGAGLAAGLPLAAIPEPTLTTKAAAWAAGTAASGAAAYRMAKDQFSGQLFDLLNERAVEERGQPLTQDEWDKVYAKYEPLAKKYGLWEAVPEALGNAMSLGIIRMAPKALLSLPGVAGRFTKTAADVIAKVGPKSELGKTLLTGAGKFAAMQMEELGTETITQMGQGAIEAEIGMRETAPGVFEAMGEVAPQTILLTSLMGGAGAVGSKAWDKWIKPKKKAGVEGEQEVNLDGKEETDPEAMANKLEADFRTGDLLPRDVAYIMGQFPKNHPVHKKGQTLLKEYVDLQQEQPIDLGRPLEGEGLAEAYREEDRITGRIPPSPLGAITQPLAGKSARESAAILQQGPTYLPQDMDRLGRIADLNQERVQSQLIALREKAAYDAEHAQAALPWAGEELNQKMAEEEERSRVQGIGGLAPYLISLLDEVKGGVPGRRLRTKDYDGTERWRALKSSYPEFMRNKYTGANAQKAIEKGLSGYEFKENETEQKQIWEEAQADARKALLRDLVSYSDLVEEDPSAIEDLDDFSYNQLITELKNEGYSTRAIQEAAERHRGAIQARAIAETARRLGIPEEEILRASASGEVDLNQIWREATLSQEELEEYYDQERKGRLSRPLGEGQEPGRPLPEEGAGGGAAGPGGILQAPEGEKGQVTPEPLAEAFDKAQKLGPAFVKVLTFAERSALTAGGFKKGNVYDLDAILEAARARGAAPAETPGEETPPGVPAPGLTESIDQAADEADQEPTEAQIEAGNYKKGHITLHGLEISIENPKGSTREGVDKKGKPWKTEMKAHYGYIRRTEGEDGDQIDTFIGPEPEGEKVFVIDQVDPETGEFDEFKVMLGYPTEKQARVGYLANYERGWKGLGELREYDLESFKEWLKNPRTTRQIVEDTKKASAEWNKKAKKLEGQAPFASGDIVESVPESGHDLRGEVLGVILLPPGEFKISVKGDDFGYRPAAEFRKVEKKEEEKPEPVTQKQVAPPQKQSGGPEKRIAKLLYEQDLLVQILQGEDFYLKLENPPYIDLVIERHTYDGPAELGWSGKPAIYITHYIEEGGDLIIDSELVFGVGDNGALGLLEVASRGIGQEIRNYVGTTRYKKMGSQKFADIFSRNIISQGWLKAKPKEPAKAKAEPITFTLSPAAKSQGEQLYTVTDAFDEAWKRQANFYVTEGGPNQIGNRLQTAREYITKGGEIEAPSVYVDQNGDVNFSDGRHRYAALRETGQPVQVSMTREAAEFAREHGLIEGEQPKVAPAPETKPEAGHGDIGTPENINVVGLAKRLITEVQAGIIRNKVMLQNKVAGWFGTTRTALLKLPAFKHKPIEEAWEYATVLWARKTIEFMKDKGKSRAEIYGVLKDKYMQQPNLATRTGTSIEYQAYSTPIHLGFLLQEFAKVGPETFVYEPTAGTGMLLTEADEWHVYANELDPERAKLLKDTFPSDRVLNHDGRYAWPIVRELLKKGAAFKAVVANPPFGSIVTEKIDGYRISKLEHAIMMDALEALGDTGRAAFIIGGHNFDGKDGKMLDNQKIFLNWLHNHYNVVANIDIPGEEYARQGTKFDVRLIVVNGRKATPSGYAPETEDSYQKVQSVDDILGLVHEVIDNGKSLVTGRPEGVGSGEEGPGGGTQPPEGKPPEVVQQPVPGENVENARQGAEAQGGLPGQGGHIPPRAGGVGGRASIQPEAGGPSGGAGTPGELATTPKPSTQQLPVEEGEPTGGQRIPGPGKLREGEPGAGERPRVPERTEGTEPGGIPGAITETLIDDLLGAFDEEIAKQEAAKKPAEPTAKAKAKETVDYVKKIAEGAKKINELLGDTGAISWQQIPDNDNTWQQIKQILRDMLDATIAAGKSATEFAKEAAKQMGVKARPYFEKFLRTEPEFQAKKEAPKPAPEPKPEDTEYQTLYAPKSKGPVIDETLVPRKMKEAIEASLDKLEKEVGDIDKYVADKLRYKSMTNLYDALAADQIDAVALAINNIDKGMGMVIGDQTGVGKGRVAAAIWRYARINQGKPIFFTAKPTLFSDFYRDMKDIGSDFNPLIMSSKEDEGRIVNQDGKVVRKVLASGKQSQYYKSLEENGPVSLSPFDGIVTTYSQIRQPNIQQRALARVFPGNIVVLDESHKAAGPDSETGNFIRGGLQQVRGVVYLSATFAKRPETMPLYYKTGMSQANMSMEELIAAVQAGDTPLQEILANGLARIGQMVRREKSFKGVSVKTYTDSKNRDRDENRGDRMTSVMRDVFKLDVAIAAAFDRAVKKARGKGDKTGKTQTVWGIPVEGSQITGDGYKISSTVDRANFAATAHNAVRQLLLAMKAELAVSRAVEALQERSHIEQSPDGTYKIVNHDGRVVMEGINKELADMSVAPKGRKPFITVDNTMGSFVKYLSDEGDIAIGQPFNIGYGQTLAKHLEKVLVVRIKDPRGNDQTYTIDINHPEFPPDLREAYEEAEEKLKTDIGDIPGSPIDYMKQGLMRAGYKVDEITGRDLVADFEDLERPKLRERTGQEKGQKKEILKAYNIGKLDALIVNRSGAEGVSAHAHPDFFKQDPRPRILFGVQAQQNVDDEVQLMGRINRKGQVALPMYEQLYLDIPGELRPASVLMRKLKSLSANTSANSDSPLAQKSLPDMNNKYGNQVVRAWVVENPAIAGAINVTPDDGFIKVSGRIAMQPTAIQREFFEECEQEYLNLIEEHKEQGTYDLEVQDIDFKARVQDKQILVQGTDESHPFGGSTFLEKLDVVNPTKPYTRERLVELVQERLGALTAIEINEKAIGELDDATHAYVDDRTATLGANYDPSMTWSALDTAKGYVLNTPLAIGNEYQITLGDAFPVMRGVLLDIRYETKKGKGNPSALSRIRLVFAVNNSLRRVTIPLSKLARGAASVGHWDTGVPDNWDEISSTGIRSSRYVITGNLLQGFAQAPESSRIVRFTMEDGTMREAILTPMVYDPAQTTTEVRVTAGQAFRAWAANNPLVSSDVTIEEDEIFVSRSKAVGEKYFTDNTLRSLLAAKDFETRGDKMRGVISERANMERAIGRIYELGGGFSLSRSTFDQLFGEAKGETHLRLDEPKPYRLSPKQLRNAAEATRFVYGFMKMAGAPQEVLDRIKVEAGPFIDLRGKNYEKGLSEWLASGGDPTRLFGAATIYNTHAVVQLATNLMNLEELERTAYHEWYHIAKRWMMPKKDADAIEKLFPGEEGRKGEAEAFASFARTRRIEGIKGDVSALHRLWMKLRRYLQIIANGLRGKGFTRSEDIFGKLYLGAYTPHFGGARGETALTLGGAAAEGRPSGLSNAVELESQGVPAQAIWQKTGWLKGVEGKWKFEIDDSKAILKPIPEWSEKATTDDTFGWVTPVTLDQVLDHPALFKYYPELKDLRVEVDPNLSSKGQFDEGRLTISLSDERLDSRENVKISLFHEIQHAIQAIEGFSRGGSPEEFAEKIANVQHLFKHYSDALRIRKILDSGKFKTEKEVADEFNKQRKEEAEALGLFYRPITGTTWADLFATAEPNTAEDLEKWANELYFSSPEIAMASKAKVRQLAGESYWKLAAEIESRDTSARLHYDAETRKKIMPYSSTDIPRSEWIVKDGTGAVTSFEVEPAYLEMANKAKKFFGLTENPMEAGYILPDGTMLDFSERKFGKAEEDAASSRFMDHREVAKLYGIGPRTEKALGPEFIANNVEKTTKAVVQFLKDTQSLRISVNSQVREGDQINVSLRDGQQLTDAQLKQLAKIQKETGGRFYYDIQDDNLKTTRSGESNRLADVREALQGQTFFRADSNEEEKSRAQAWIQKAKESPESEQAKAIKENEEYWEQKNLLKTAKEEGAKVINRVKKDEKKWVAEERPNISWWAKMLGSPEFTFEKVPAAERVFNASLEKVDDAHSNYNNFTDQDQHMAALRNFSKERPTEYKKFEDLIWDADRTQHKYNTDQLKRKGFSDQGISVWKSFRTMMDNALDALMADWRAIVQYCEENNLPLPEIVTHFGGKQIRVNLRVAMAIMGQMRGWYAPRVREPGRYQVTARKKGANPFMKNYDLYYSAEKKAKELEAQGYEILRTEKGKIPKTAKIPEDVFLLAGKTMAINDMINTAMQSLSRDREYKLEDFGLRGFMRTFGPGSREFVLAGPTNTEMNKVIKKLGGHWWPDKEHGGQKAWHFTQASEDMEYRIARALSLTAGMPMASDSHLLFAHALASEVSNLVRGRGFRSHMIQRKQLRVVQFETSGKFYVYDRGKRIGGPYKTADEAKSAHDIGGDVWMGYETNLMAATSRYLVNLSNGIAKKNMMAKMVQAVSGTDIKPQDFDSYEAYLDAVQDRRIDSKTQSETWDAVTTYMQEMARNEEFSDRVIGFIKALAVLKYLGLRLGSAAINLTSLVTSVPGAMHGYAKIPIHDAPRLIGKALNLYRQFRWGDPEGLSPDVRRVFETIRQKGWDEAQYTNEAIQVLKGKYGTVWDKLSRYGMIFFGTTEHINRVSTIAGAYMGIKEQNPGMSFDEAITLAKKVSDRAHGVYGKTTRPYLAQGSNPFAQVARMFYVFSKFSHTYLQTMYDLGFNKKDRIAATYMMVAPAILAGGTAIPLIGPALMYALGQVLAALGDDRPEEGEERLYAWLEENLGTMTSDFARFGVAGAVAGVNVKGSLEIRAFEGIPMTIPEILGAPGSVVQDVYEGGKDIAKGQVYRGVERMMPGAIRGGMQAAREYAQGVTTKKNVPMTYRGRQIQPTFEDTIIKALTFSPAGTAKIKEQRWADQQLIKKYQDQRGEIYARIRAYYMKPSQKRSADDYAAIIEDIREYNETIKANRLHTVEGIGFITKQSIKAALRRKQ